MCRPPARPASRAPTRPCGSASGGLPGYPADIVAKINADVRRALADPGVKDKLANLGNDAMDMSPQEFARFVRSEIDDYQRVVRAAGIKPQ